jgi:hypothetical protein
LPDIQIALDLQEKGTGGTKHEKDEEAEVNFAQKSPPGIVQSLVQLSSKGSESDEDDRAKELELRASPGSKWFTIPKE